MRTLTSILHKLLPRMHLGEVPTHAAWLLRLVITQRAVIALVGQTAHELAVGIGTFVDVQRLVASQDGHVEASLLAETE